MDDYTKFEKNRTIDQISFRIFDAMGESSKYEAIARINENI